MASALGIAMSNLVLPVLLVLLRLGRRISLCSRLERSAQRLRNGSFGPSWCSSIKSQPQILCTPSAKNVVFMTKIKILLSESRGGTYAM